MKNDKVRITPDPSLYSTLRNTGYDNIPAIEDLMDNSIDAKANNIHVFIDSLDKIIIADDGIGMSYDTLIQALKLGGRKKHKEDDLGKFGVGLITGSISLGKKFTIISKNNGLYHTAICDCAEIDKANDFIATVRVSNELEKISFNDRTNHAENGTVLIIDDCDKMQYDTADELIKKLKEDVKRIYRVFMRDENKHIFVNGLELQVNDPLMLSNPKTKIRLDKTVDVELDNGNVEKLRILAVTLPPYGDNVIKRDRVTNLKTQGFYALRNNREIASGMEIRDVFKKHNYFNYYRIELQFSSGLDDEMNVNFSKHSISPSSRIINILVRELSSVTTKVRAEETKRQKENNERRKKAKNPFIAEGTKQPLVKTGPIEVKDGENPIISTAVVQTEEQPVFEGVKIGVRFKTEKDALFDVSVSKETASVFYNAANGFYKDRIVNSSDGAEYKRILDLTIESVIETCVENGVSPSMVEKVSKKIADSLVEDRS